MDINRAGRVLLVRSAETTLTTNTDQVVSLAVEYDKTNTADDNRDTACYLLRPIPLSVWPFVLARLTRQARYPNFVPVQNNVNGIYYLIRHGPIFMEKIARCSPNTQNQRLGNNCDNKTKKDIMHRSRLSRKRKRDPALGGYCSLAEFLRYEAGVTS
mmetsp:Transcript_16003/g.28788  ORF Transcript_16003/g.28788 Transcript_16003/m.28788 type:complete len:157 (-) Transcript_16003:176-646(-)